MSIPSYLSHTKKDNPHMDTARIGLSHMGRKAQQDTIPTWIQPASGSHTWGGKHNTQSPHGYSPHRVLTHGEESTTYNPHMDTARIGLSHMGKKAQHTIPTWIQPASGSHTWGRKHNTQSPHGYSPHRALTHGEESTTHNPHMDTARIRLSHMGRKAQHTIPTWIQPASGSHTWGGKHNTQSPHGYSPHWALTHGEESTTHNPHMDTARIGLSHMGRKAHLCLYSLHAVCFELFVFWPRGMEQFDLFLNGRYDNMQTEVFS